MLPNWITQGYLYDQVWPGRAAEKKRVLAKEEGGQKVVRAAPVYHTRGKKNPVGGPRPRPGLPRLLPRPAAPGAGGPRGRISRGGRGGPMSGGTKRGVGGKLGPSGETPPGRKKTRPGEVGRASLGGAGKGTEAAPARRVTSLLAPENPKRAAGGRPGRHQGGPPEISERSRGPKAGPEGGGLTGKNRIAPRPASRGQRARRGGHGRAGRPEKFRDDGSKIRPRLGRFKRPN